MARSSVESAHAAANDVLGTSRFVVPFFVYAAFAAIVYLIHGAEPPLSIDHISYIKLANEIRSEFPLGDYWRSFNSVRSYGVILAYAFDLTGSHLISFKLLLAAFTVAYLWAFQVFMGLATPSRTQAMLFSLCSGLFVSFGAPTWGMTDFAASLSRTIVLPPIVLLVWFFFRAFASPLRYAVFPSLVFLSLLHLSALHVFLVFGVFELLDFAFARRCRVDRKIAYFAVALIASVAMQVMIAGPSGSAIGYVRYVLRAAVPSPANVLPAPVAALPSPPRMLPAPAAAVPSPPPMLAAPAAAVRSPPPMLAAPAAAVPEAKPPTKLTSREAWKIELLAFPWRNFPPTLATLATIASSFGVIFLLAVAGAVGASRSGAAKPLDREMVTFAFAVLLAAYGLQILLWSVRSVIPFYPINFEEVRAINMLMIPSIYFVFRLYEHAPRFGGLSERSIRIAIVVAFVLQPIFVVRALPAQWREGLIERTVAWGALKTSDAPRMLYARHFLGLAGDGRRFYYSSRSALEWLERNTGPSDRVLTNLNELNLSSVKTVGPFLGILDLDIWDARRATWAETLDAVDRALAARDLDQVMALARSLGATYAVVDWPVEQAAYRDDDYSIVRVLSLPPAAATE